VLNGVLQSKRRGGLGVGEARHFIVVVLLLVGSFVVAGCGASGSAEEPDSTLTVFAASSLADAFEELGGSFERETGATVRFNFASSSTLAAQIEQGAPADVFASADLAQMENVVEAGLAAGEPRVFARGRIVVVVPADNPGDVGSLADLDEPGLRLVLAQEDVPAAKYAGEVLANASKDPQYGEGFRRAVLGNVVSREEDVRASVNRVVVGDADATFGYASDVTPEVRERVEVVEVPQEFQVVAEYPVSALSRAGDPELAERWVELVTGEEGQRVLAGWGFEPVR
jgi:molybdate transport system substrate-binding protein